MKILETAWNQAFEDYAIQESTKEPKVRNRLWASELGKAPIDVYLKMKGTLASNPADARAMRKFEAGNIWENIVGIVLKRAGILISGQEWVEHKYPNLLGVGGYLDFKTGGFVDWKKAKELVESDEFEWLPDRTKFATKQVIENLAVNFPQGLPEMVLEIKSTSGFMYDNYLHSGANENHILQLYHYLKSLNLPSGHIVYVDRDSVRMTEFEVNLNDPATEKLYKGKIEILTDYILNEKQPPLEPFITFDERTARISTNWKVVYSDYLTMLYSHNKKVFEHGEEVRDYFDPLVTQFNSLLKRMAEDKTLTDKNKEWLVGLQEFYSDEEIEKFVKIVRNKLASKEEQE